MNVMVNIHQDKLDKLQDFVSLKNGVVKHIEQNYSVLNG